MLKSKSIRFVIFGQIGFIVSLLLCILLLPKGLSANDGFSYYGVHNRTVVPYTLGLIWLGGFYWLMAHSLPAKPLILPLKYLTYSILPLFLLAIVTPYKHSSGYHWAHVATTIVVFTVQMVAAGWVVAMIKWDATNIGLVSLLAIEGLIALLFVQPANGFLIQAETAFQVTFALLLARSLHNLVRRSGYTA